MWLHVHDCCSMPFSLQTLMITYAIALLSVLSRMFLAFSLCSFYVRSLTVYSINLAVCMDMCVVSMCPCVHLRVNAMDLHFNCVLNSGTLQKTHL